MVSGRQPRTRSLRAAMARWRVAVPRLLADPNAFIPFVFHKTGQPFTQAPLHRELQAFLNDQTRALIELPRDHGKTTQVLGRVLWELARNPDLRVKIVCATDAIAEDRVRFLRDNIEHNLRLNVIAPQLIPGEPWQAEKFTISRPGTNVGPSVSAFGIGSGSTGSRADLLICDDIVDAKSIRSQAERDAVKTEFENNLMNLLEPKGRFWGLCTPWHDDDLNARLKRNPAFSLFRRAIGEGDEPVWPEWWPRHRLLARKQEIGEAAYARAYRLVNVSDEHQPIRPEWIITLDARPDPRQVADVLLAVDPAASDMEKSDPTAFVVLGRTGDHGVVCLEAIAGRWDIHGLVAKLRAIDRAWQPSTILFETNGAFRHTFDTLKIDPQFIGKLHHVTATKNKLDRVGTLGLYLSAGHVRFAPGLEDLRHQMVSFPLAEHDDLVDACAMGVEWLMHRSRAMFHTPGGWDEDEGPYTRHDRIFSSLAIPRR